MADNYIDFDIFMGATTADRNDRIGYNRTDTVKALVHDTNIDDTASNEKSLHLADDSTDYQNTSGKTAYAMVTVFADTDAGQRKFKLWSAPSTDSNGSATEVFDSDDVTTTTSWDAVNEGLTSWLVPIQNNHYIVLENTSGATSRNIDVPATTPMVAFVIEQA